jgi:5-formyltetrahydrofolate cyclo-ligase
LPVAGFAGTQAVRYHHLMKLSKESLRQAFKQRRRDLGPKRRAEAGRLVSERLATLETYLRASEIAAFWPLPEEIDIRPFINLCVSAGKNIYLPRVNRVEERLEFCHFGGDPEELAAGPLGILEPLGPEAPYGHIDLLIVPGLAFDAHHHRLGYGAGLYDRFLKAAGAPSIGVAFDVQTIDILPTAEHDVAVDQVATEARLF